MAENFAEAGTLFCYAARATLATLQQERPNDGVVHMYAEKFAQEKELPRELTFEFDTK